MRIIYSLSSFVFILTFTQSNAQVNTTVLDENNMAVTLSDGGVSFSQPEYEVGVLLTGNGCETPKGLGIHSLSGLSMWFSGQESDTGLPHSSAPMNEAYRQQFIGPLNTHGHALDFQDQWLHSLFPITTAEIENHITNFNNPGYIIPESILSWPAHGDVSLGFNYFLAPFVDVDGDGTYIPSNGDFPCIKGDKAVFIMLNDVEEYHGCGGVASNQAALGIQIQMLFYQYSTQSGLENVTFCDTKIHNQSEHDYVNFKSSLHLNTIIGSFEDDHVGTEVQRNTIYAYNGDSLDYSVSSPGHQEHPPAIGVVSLNHTIARSRYFTHPANYPYNIPVYPPDIRNIMNGNLLDGSPQDQDYFFTGNPYEASGDLDTNQYNSYHDKMVYTIDAGTLLQGESKQFDFAVVYSQGINYKESVNDLFNDIDATQTFYNNQSVECFLQYLNVEDSPEIMGVTIYPNPSNGLINIKLDDAILGSSLEVLDLSGRKIQPTKQLNYNHESLALKQPPGIYIIRISKGNMSQSYRLIIE
ncbi:MAG: hypothetical protein ACI837_001314 [Crocinitomicaceae bacterium]|jgi:hypothetical protein